MLNITIQKKTTYFIGSFMIFGVSSCSIVEIRDILMKNVTIREIYYRTVKCMLHFYKSS